MRTPTFIATLVATTLPTLLPLAGAKAERALEPYLGVTLEEIYDSNVMNSRGGDVVTRVGPRLGLRVRGPRLRAGADYRLAYHAYARESADDTINHRGAFYAEGDLARRLGAKVTAVVVDADDPVLLERPNVLLPLGGVVDLTTTARIEGAASRRTWLGVEHAYRRSRFDLANGPAALASDGDEHRLDAGGTWRASRRLDLGVAARWQRFVSDDAATNTEDALTPWAQATWRANRRTRLESGVGPSFFVSGGALTWQGRARIVHTGRRTRATLTAVRTIYGGTGADRAIWEESLYAKYAWQAKRTVHARASIGLARDGDAPKSPSHSSGLVGRSEIAWRATRSAELVLFAEHRAQDASGGLGFGDTRRTFVGLRLAAFAGAEPGWLSEVP